MISAPVTRFSYRHHRIGGKEKGNKRRRNEKEKERKNKRMLGIKKGKGKRQNEKVGDRKNNKGEQGIKDEMNLMKIHN